MAKFRKRPVVIDAVQLRWDTWNEVCDFADVGGLANGRPEGCFIDPEGHPVGMGKDYEERGEIGLLIPTLEGLMVARQNDWIIRGVAGELYACKPDIFEQTYEEVDGRAAR